MRVKRYVVDSMPDALQRIKADLGKDAIILNTKNIKTGGFFGFFTRKQIEVIAAVDVNKGPVPSAQPQSSSPSDIIEEKRPKLTQKVSFQVDDEVKKEIPTYDLKSIVAKKSPIFTLENQTVEAGGASLPAEMPARTRENIAVVDSLPKPNFSSLRNKLRLQDVEDQWIEEVIQRMSARYSGVLLQNDQSQIQHAKLVIEEMLTERQSKQSLIANDTRFVKFFGPTGVGKTTTIAKLAAEGVLKNKRKVGLITTDTYRIGAVDQLRTYSNILNVPLEVVFQPGEMSTALENLSACDLILVDTAGRNYRKPDYAMELAQYFPSLSGGENYIVLSLTAKNSDMVEILENFKCLPVEKVIFTKSDETQTYGSILNMVMRYHLSLSYLTTGQNVPDDIRVAVPSKVANLILGEG
ncbi:flagellar biosynthesis protein FlhF [Ammoniphilus sp. CFH 90114]|uniref:flagellar biosynthesis protein FlhF n=1 Tax=Ammoniphilus sp. CFH 90114 TaxID=2493665 RepID=UPI00100E9F91|nr:flagellar biosynthesis protein FlhF [Ammoniphilus sp. CFH 90114]RXT15131.1 flagellar biosynthesis protein FlhF [Ammoniphilus sp. CFH 90114]